MKAAIITIGDELLIGQTVDTNSAWIGAEMSKSGFDVYRITSIHDRKDDIIYALNEVAGKADVVLITGGLGPTSDDITKQTLCEYFNTRLITNDEVLRMLEEMIRRNNFAMNENNRHQADVPESCKVLTNAKGTAPGMWFEKDGTIFVSMPGVPHEMKYLMTEHVLPELNKRFTSQVIIHRNIMTFGLFEAKLAETLIDFEAELPKNIKLAYLPAFGIIKLRLTATGQDRNILSGNLNFQVDKLYKIIPEYIYGEDEELLEMIIGKLLKTKNKTVSTAESCTGGEIAHMLTSIHGSSDYYNGSIVAYANSVKIQILGVKKELIDKFGAVSEEVVKEMATGAKKLFNTDYSVATSGIAGPDGGTEMKPVGTLWMAVASEKGVIAEKVTLGFDRNTNIRRFSLSALNLLRKQIING
ncbi:MAG TPA: competence/damage-inducible protein A [Bacteroidales bacterium]|nr:competence/damage-inducible protein A [Bacteroidales bacterium]HPT22379.1 competence/damage-inducible protein A [Bacteroidales bacterium]